jgi:predicted HD superfamily hydrolase involved in NAD metabolism
LPFFVTFPEGNWVSVSKGPMGWIGLETKYLALLRQRLSEKTCFHSLGVGRTAKDLAGALGLSGEKAFTAGILHDYARELREASLLEEARRRRLPVDRILQVHPVLLHGPVGAELVREDLGIEDPEILEAIRCHTCGGESIGSLARIVYAADIIEPSRDFPGVEELRRQVRENFQTGLIRVVESTMNYVLRQRYLLHPDTLWFWNELIQEDRK